MLFDKLSFKLTQSIERLMALSVILIAFLIYIAPFVLFEQASSQAALTRYILFFTSVFFIWKFKKNFSELGFDSVHVFIVLLLFVYLLLNAAVLSNELRSVRRLLFVFLLFLPFVFLRINVILAERVVLFFVFLVFLFSLFSLVYGFFNEILPTGYRQGGIYQSGVREIAYFGNTIVAGLHYGVALIGALYFFLTTREKIVLAFSCLMIVSLSLYMYLTFARTAWAAVVVGSIVLFVLLYERKLRRRFWAAASVFLFAGIYYVLTKTGYEVGVRGLTYRDEIWLESIRRIKEHLILGHGLLNEIDWIYVDSIKQSFSNSHSLYLEILYQVGAVGLALYLILLFYSGCILYRSAQNKIYGKFSVFILAILIGGAVASLVDIRGWVDSPNYVWIWVWVPLACSLSFSRKLRASSLR